MPNQRYTYDGKLKEIDLHAFFEDIKFTSKSIPQHTSSNLIIECKKSKEKPWVFFSSAMFQKSDSFCFLKYLSTYDFYFDKKKNQRLLGQLWEEIKKNHYLDTTVPKCISYFEAFKNPNQESQIYGAIQSVLTFMRYNVTEWKNSKLEEYDAVNDFYYPIIVLDGDLFEANVKNGKTKLNKKDHLQIRTIFDGEIFIIDVVKKEYFETFFNLIEKNHIEIVKAISKLKIPKEICKKILEKNKISQDKFIMDFPIDYYKCK